MQAISLEVMGQSPRIMQAGSGATVLFLHGAGGLSWTPMLERLSTSCHVIAAEHPGFGTSRIPAWMASVGDLALYYLDLLDILGQGQIHLVGHSLGGWTAAELAIRNTRNLRSLTLLAPAGVKGDVPFPDIFQWSPEETARRSCVDPALAEQRVRVAVSADPELVRQNQAAARHLASEPLLHNPQLPFWLHRVDVPALLVWGEQDQLVPFACAEPYQRGLADAQLVSFPETGHALPHERPVEIAETLDRFFTAAG